MKRLVSILLFLLVSLMAFPQKISVLVIPDEHWCEDNGYVITQDIQGSLKNYPDYDKAFGDVSMKGAIDKVVKGFEGTYLKAIAYDQLLASYSEDESMRNMATSKKGKAVSHTSYDELVNREQPDIIVKVWYNITKQGANQIFQFSLRGIDTYTSANIATFAPASNSSYSANLIEFVDNAVIPNMDDFLSSLEEHFSDIENSGRSVTVTIQVFEGNDAGIDLDTEYGPEETELVEIIDDWMEKNSVEGQYDRKWSTENEARYEVRIPLRKPGTETRMTAEDFTKQLRKFLSKAPFSIKSDIQKVGVGRCVLRIGEK